MDCATAESMVNRYIAHALSVEELEEFLEHVESCASCYDELETYFIVHEAMQQLDEAGTASTLDLRSLLELDIRKSRHYIHKKKMMRLILVFVSFLAVAALVALLVFLILELR